MGTGHAAEEVSSVIIEQQPTNKGRLAPYLAQWLAEIAGQCNGGEFFDERGGCWLTHHHVLPSPAHWYDEFCGPFRKELW
jgi:hypothetical protein